MKQIIWTDNYLMHYGIKGKSGRYPPGSGKNPKTGYRATIRQYRRSRRKFYKQNNKDFQTEKKQNKKNYKLLLKSNKPGSFKERRQRRKEYSNTQINTENEYAVRSFLNSKKYKSLKTKTMASIKGTNTLRYKINKKLLDWPIEQVTVKGSPISKNKYRVEDKKNGRYEIERIREIKVPVGDVDIGVKFYKTIGKNYKPRKTRIKY